MNQQGQNTNQNASKTNAQTNSIQRELEKQLRAFGEVATDSVLNGIDGKGEEIGSAAKGVGLAFADFVQDEIKRAAQNAINTPAQPYAYTAAPRSAASYHSTRRVPKNKMMAARAQSRFGVGCVQCFFGGLFTFAFGLSGVITFAVGVVQATASEVLAMQITGGSLLVIALLFVWMLVCGTQNISLSKRMGRYATMMGEGEKVSYDTLSSAAGCAQAQTRKDFKKIVKNNWAQVWLDDSMKMVYLTNEAYRADCLTMPQTTVASAANAQNEQTQKQAAEQAAKAANFPLESVESFIAVLGKQQALMDDETAAKELALMQETSQDIYDWVLAHPETAPRVRRFSSYYMPTTLKLLHSYNEVKDQQGDNAQSIRRDIAGILHTLNTAFNNLHDTLLSDVALDISSEIAALQGMLAQDGLSQNSDFPV